MANKTKTENTTPAPAPAANPPMADGAAGSPPPPATTVPATQVDIIGRAKSDYGRIPLLPKQELRRRITGKGEAVLTLEAFDWQKVPVEHVARAKAAVAVIRAMGALKTAIAVYERALSK